MKLNFNNILPSAIGAVGSIIGNVQQSHNIDKQIRAQQKENQLNREYNFMLAQKQNEWNLQQWEKENQYNSPQAQMQRYKDAGLNPDLIYGNSNLSASSPMLTSGAPSSPVDMSSLSYKPTFDKVVNSALNASSIVADIKEKDSNARNKDSDTDLNRKQLQWSDLTYRSTIATNFSTVYVNRSLASLNEEKKKEVVKNMEFADKSMEQINANIDLMRKDLEIKDIQKTREEIGKRIDEKTLEDISATIGLKKAQTRDILETLATRIAIGEETVLKIRNERFFIGTQNKRLIWENDYFAEEKQREKDLFELTIEQGRLQNEYQDTANDWQIFSTILHGASSIATGFGSAALGFKSLGLGSKAIPTVAPGGYFSTRSW